MTSTPPTYIAHDIPDLLDVLPALFGFTPRESFIAIATHGERIRIGFRLRMDLPAAEDIQLAARQAATYVRRQDPDGAILIALTADADLGDALMAAVIAELDGMVVHEAVRADAEHYWVYTDGLPGHGVTYTSRYSEAVLDAVMAGQQILPDREALVTKFAGVSGPRKTVMMAATDRALNAIAHELSDCPHADLGAVGMAVLEPIISGLAANATPADADLATLAVWVSSRSVRDEVWFRMDRTNAESSFALWTAVARSVVEPFEPPVLCLAAYSAWLCGDGAQALIAVERALEIQPDYTLAHLILRLIMSAISPAKWEGMDTQPGATS